MKNRIIALLLVGALCLAAATSSWRTTAQDEVKLPKLFDDRIKPLLAAEYRMQSGTGMVLTVRPWWKPK